MVFRTRAVRPGTIIHHILIGLIHLDLSTIRHLRKLGSQLDRLRVSDFFHQMSIKLNCIIKLTSK